MHLPEHTPSFSAPGYNDLGQVALQADHPDHTATGRLVRDALAEYAGLGCLKRIIYMGYAVLTLPDAMSAFEKLAQAEAYSVLNTVLTNQGNVSLGSRRQSMHRGSLDSFHTAFYGKQNAREEAGAATCRVPPALRRESSHSARVQNY